MSRYRASRPLYGGRRRRPSHRARLVIGGRLSQTGSVGLRSTSLAVLASVLAGLAFSAPAGAAGSCKKRGTREVFKDGPVRILMTKADEKHFYLCTRAFGGRGGGTRRQLPQRPAEVPPLGELRRLHLAGRSLAGGHRELGWVSVRRQDQIGGARPRSHSGVAVGPDGAIRMWRVTRAPTPSATRHWSASGASLPTSRKEAWRTARSSSPHHGVEADRLRRSPLLARHEQPEPWRFIREFESPPHRASRPLMAAGPAGALLVHRVRRNKIGRVGTDGSFREFRVPTSGSKPEGSRRDRMERSGSPRAPATKSGASPRRRDQRVRLPTAKSTPTGIAAGPDGALWFLESEVTRSAASAPAARSGCQLPSRNLGYTGITAGPDGALWYTAVGGGGDLTSSQRIGQHHHRWNGQGVQARVRRELSCRYRRGPRRGASSTPTGYNRIGRVTTDGKIREFVLAGTSVPTGITAGPDGALWYTDQSEEQDRAHHHGREGERVQAPHRRCGALRHAAGPDGALWFTDYASSKVGRINGRRAVAAYFSRNALMRSA